MVDYSENKKTPDYQYLWNIMNDALYPNNADKNDRYVFSWVTDSQTIYAEKSKPTPTLSTRQAANVRRTATAPPPSSYAQYQSQPSYASNAPQVVTVEPSSSYTRTADKKTSRGKKSPPASSYTVKKNTVPKRRTTY